MEAAVLLSIGCWYLVDLMSLRFSYLAKEAGLTALIYTTPVLMCVFGVIDCFVALLGCLAARQKNHSCFLAVSNRLRIRILRIFTMPTNFKNKIRSADIIYEIYPASITKCSVKFFADIYYYL